MQVEVKNCALFECVCVYSIIWYKAPGNVDQ